MKSITRTIFVLITIVALSGCLEATMKKMNDMALESQHNAVAEPVPEPGKAMVVFMNNNAFDRTERSFIYDGDNYIGISVPSTKFAYQAEPGEHLFMLASANAGFMGADLVAGKTYYAEIRHKLTLEDYKITVNPETGYFKLYPFNGMSQDSFTGRNMQSLLDQMNTLVRWAEPLNESEQARWDKVRAALDINAMKDKYLPEYEAEGDDKPFLLKISGS